MDGVEIPKFDFFTKTWHNSSYGAISPTREQNSASGKNVVVTGGGTGVGKSIAKSFAQAGAASVSILGRRPDRLIAAVEEIVTVANARTKLHYEVADLMERADVDKALQSIVNKFGKISIFVSNAGWLPMPQLLSEHDPQVFMRSFDLNVRSTFNAIQAFMPVADTEPTFLNISTGVAHLMPMPKMSAYAASKAANAKMVDYLAAENPHIHVVNTQPGVMFTEMHEGSSDFEAQDDSKPLRSLCWRRTDEVTVELPGHFSVWLACPEARFLKSTFVWANWDVDELIQRADEIQISNLIRVKLEGAPFQGHKTLATNVQ